LFLVWGFNCNIYLQRWNSIDFRYKTEYAKQWIISIRIAVSIVVQQFVILIHVPAVYLTRDFRVYLLRTTEVLQMLWCLSLSSDMFGFRGASGL
jgi:hypothetical protein